MSRAQRVASALNDLNHLFSEEDQEGIQDWVSTYFTAPSVSFEDDDSDERDSDSDSGNNFTSGTLMFKKNEKEKKKTTT